MDKQKFWNDVMRGDGWTRFVAQTKLVQVEVTDIEEGRYTDVVTRRIEENIKFDMWAPESVDEEYNLVMSLCNDGAHRPILDLDFPKENLQFQPVLGGSTRMYVTYGGSRAEVKVPGDNVVVVPSTHFAHLYSDEAMSFAGYVELLGTIPGEDARKYGKNVQTQGFGSARPPWVKKEEKEVKPEIDLIPVSDWDDSFMKNIRLPQGPGSWTKYSQDIGGLKF